MTTLCFLIESLVIGLVVARLSLSGPWSGITSKGGRFSAYLFLVFLVGIAGFLSNGRTTFCYLEALL